MDPRPISYRQLIRLPNVFALLAATCLSRLASRMFAIAIVLHVLSTTGSPTIAGWITFAAMAPGLAVSPLAGAFLDRSGARRGIVIDLAASAAVVLTLAAVIRTAGDHTVVVAGLTTVYALTSPLSASGIRVLLPRLVPPRVLDRANALDTAVHAVVGLIGPPLAGAMVGFAGSVAAFLAIAAIYAGAAIGVLMVRSPPSPSSPGQLPPVHPSPNQSSPAPLAGARSFVRQAMDGVLEVLRSPHLRGLAIGYSLNMVTWGIVWVAIPVLMAQRFASGTWQSASGLLWAGMGVAGGIGALVAGHAGVIGREVPVMALCMAMTALAVAAAPSFAMPGFIGGLLLMGFLAGPIDVGVLTSRQRRTEPSRLGRVLTVSMSFNLSGFPIGTALGGMLVAWSPAAAFLAAALASALAALATWRLIPGSDRDR